MIDHLLAKANSAGLADIVVRDEHTLGGSGTHADTLLEAGDTTSNGSTAVDNGTYQLISTSCPSNTVDRAYGSWTADCTGRKDIVLVVPVKGVAVCLAVSAAGDARTVEGAAWGAVAGCCALASAHL